MGAAWLFVKMTFSVHRPELRLGNTATNSDTFNVFPFPVPAVNPSTNKLGHLYVAYADRATNANDKADVFFVRSSDGGTNWTSPLRVNPDTTTNDQWMPVLAVKPDGTQLFMAWYDRRNHTNNALLEVYGCFGTIATNGDVSLGNKFRISTVSFPMAFAGTRAETEPIYEEPGFYDPVYPPGDTNLHWWYPEWPLSYSTPPTYQGHVGEYSGVFAGEQKVCFAWTDYRLPAAGSMYPRTQSDIRFVVITWPGQ